MYSTESMQEMKAHVHVQVYVRHSVHVTFACLGTYLCQFLLCVLLGGGGYHLQNESVVAHIWLLHFHLLCIYIVHIQLTVQRVLDL